MGRDPLPQFYSIEMTKIACKGGPYMETVAFFTNLFFSIKMIKQSPKLFPLKFHFKNVKYSETNHPLMITFQKLYIYSSLSTLAKIAFYPLFQHKGILTIIKSILSRVLFFTCMT
jgi:hypothetical protein